MPTGCDLISFSLCQLGCRPIPRPSLAPSMRPGLAKTGLVPLTDLPDGLSIFLGPHFQSEDFDFLIGGYSIRNHPGYFYVFLCISYPKKNIPRSKNLWLLTKDAKGQRDLPWGPHTSTRVRPPCTSFCQWPPVQECRTQCGAPGR